MTLWLGWYYARKQETTQEYFVGNGRMNPILIGVSLFATLLSTISYLSLPGEILGKGPVWMVTVIAFPLSYLAIAYWLLPVYMTQRVTSAYELLEVKLGLSVRLLGAVMFLMLRLVWMSLLLYMTAEALVTMMGASEKLIPWVVIVAGSVALIYTSLGGLRAVVITDLFQTILLYGGALLVLAMVTWQMGGLGWIPTEWHENWDTQPVFSLDPTVRVTMLGVVLNVLIWQVCTAGGDQTSVQRFMATEDLKAARKAIATQMTVAVAVNLTLAIVGVALLGYFSAHPDQIPLNKDLKADADKMFPLFIAHQLPMGISGLVISAMFAAAMSSMDSGVNSITAVVMTDFFDRFGLSPKDEKDHVFRARILALTIGVIVVIGSSYIGQVPGNITAVTQKTTNLLTTPIFCLFFFALFVPFSNTPGVWAGAICGVSTAVLIAFSGPIVTACVNNLGWDPYQFRVAVTEVLSEDGQTVIGYTVADPVSFQWIAPLAVLANVGVGSLVSLLTGGARAGAPLLETPSSDD
ncbi:MAG: sodium/solute symporter [Planctomycetaceae bacterium]|nr:sodium/solute symporter [Planctomycetaceae bacterium]